MDHFNTHYSSLEKKQEKYKIRDRDLLIIYESVNMITTSCMTLNQKNSPVLHFRLHLIPKALYLNGAWSWPLLFKLKSTSTFVIPKGSNLNSAHTFHELVRNRAVRSCVDRLPVGSRILVLNPSPQVLQTFIALLLIPCILLPTPSSQMFSFPSFLILFKYWDILYIFHF